MQENNKKLVIFDMDGVLANTAPFHIKAWDIFSEKYDLKIPDNFFLKTFGRGNDEIFPMLFDKSFSKKELNYLCQKKEAIFRKLIYGNIKPFPGVVELIKELYNSKRYIISIGSSAIRANIENVIKGIGIEKYISCIVAEEDVSKAKPDPEVFIKTSQRSKVNVSRSVVIEDSVYGVQAAKQADIKVVAVTNTHPAEHFSDADMVVGALTELNIENIDNLTDNNKYV